MKKRLLLAVVLVLALILSISIPALAEPPDTDVVNVQGYLFAALFSDGSFSGGASGSWVGAVGRYWVQCAFYDTNMQIHVNAAFSRDQTRVSGKSLEKVTTAAIPVQVSHSGVLYPGTVQVTWEGVGDIASSFSHFVIWDPDIGRWLSHEAGTTRGASREAVAVVTVDCPDLDYHRVVTSALAILQYWTAHGVELSR